MPDAEYDGSRDSIPRPGPRAVLPVAFATRFLQWGSLGLIIPVSNLLRLSKGLSLAELGFSAAVVAGVVVALEVPTGVLADRLGRKRVYMASLTFFALSCLALIVGRGFAAVTAGFALYGVSRALSSGSLEALLIDRYIALEGKEKLPRLISITNAADTAGLALGSLCGGLIPSAWQTLAPGAGRYDGNLIAMLALTAVLGVLTASAVSEEPVRARGSEGVRDFLSGSARAIAHSPPLMMILCSMIAWGFAISSVETYWQPRLAQILGSDESGWIFGAVSAGYFLAALVGSLAAPPLLEKTKINPYVFLFLLRIIMAGFIALMAFQTSAGGFSAVYLLMFCWNGMANPPEGTVINLQIPSERRASLLSVASLVMQLGGLAGAAVFGILAGRFAIPVLWQVAAAVFGASSVLYLFAGRRKPGEA
jgi:MFS family permease